MKKLLIALTETTGIGFYWYNRYARESSEKSLEQKYVTNICFGSSCENVFKFQKTNCSEADRSTSSNFRDNAHRAVERLCFWLQNEHGRQFCEELAPRPGGGGGNDRVHMKPICMSRSKHENFRSCKFIQGKYFLRFLYFALYHSVHRYEHYCRSSPQP